MDDVAQQLAQRVQDTYMFKHTKGKGLEVPQPPQAPGSVLNDAREQLMAQKSHTSKLLAGGARVSMLRLMLEQEDLPCLEQAEDMAAGGSGCADEPDSPDPVQDKVRKGKLRKRVTVQDGLPDEEANSTQDEAASIQHPEPLIKKGVHKRFSFLDVSRLLGDDGGSDEDGTVIEGTAQADSKESMKKHKSLEFSFLDANEGRAGKHLKMLRAVSCRKPPQMVSNHPPPHRSKTLSTLEHVPADDLVSEIGAYGGQQSQLSLHSTATSQQSSKSKAFDSSDSLPGWQQAGTSTKPTLPKLQLPAALQEAGAYDASTGALDSLRAVVDTPSSSRGALSSIRSAFSSAKVQPDEFGWPTSPVSTPRSRGGLPLASAIHAAPRKRPSSLVVPGPGSHEGSSAGPSSPLAVDSTVSARSAVSSPKGGAALPPLSINTGPGSVPAPSRGSLLSPRASALQGAAAGFKEPGLFDKLKKISSIFNKG